MTMEETAISMSQQQAAPVTQTAEGVQPAQAAALYVGDLSPDVDENMLFQRFSEASPGQVMSVRVCRDSTTRQSLGYAYVNFTSTAGAEAAMEQLNFQPIGRSNKSMRLMWSQRDPTLRRSGTGNILVKNLPLDISEKDVQSAFSTFGNILSLKLAVDENGKSRGFAYVHFEREQDARDAIENTNDLLSFNDAKPVQTCIWQSNRIRKSHTEQLKASFTNVYFKDFAETATRESLETLFAKFGKITSFSVPEQDGKLKGFGFCNYEKHESAAEAIKELNGSTQDGKELYVGRFQSKRERAEERVRRINKQKEDNQARFRNTNLYVKHIAEDVTDDEFRDYFSTFGTITSCVIARDSKGVSKGFGFVCYQTVDEAQKAIGATNQLFHNKPLYIAIHQRKEERQQQQAARYQMIHPSFFGMPVFSAQGSYPPAAFYQQRVPFPSGPFPQAAAAAAARGFPPTQHVARIPGQPQNGSYGGPYFMPPFLQAQAFQQRQALGQPSNRGTPGASRRAPGNVTRAQGHHAPAPMLQHPQA